jgi:tetratricopeptide (TPR) repeat protein
MQDDYPFDLGRYTRPVTSVPLAQRWFDRGLTWLYGYNHEEAIACFEKAIGADPDLAFAHWGIAYAIGPNCNKPWEVFTEAEKAPALKTAHDAIARGLACAGLGAAERALLKALAERYPEDPSIEDYEPWTNAFAARMREIQARFPEDLEVTFITAEALMNRTPWQLWNLATGAPNPEGDALEAKALLDAAFQRPEAWDHPGLLNMYVHLMEMSPTPEAALRHGDRLTGLCPDAGHLVHMATHIDVLCGDYQNVVARNHAAADADDLFTAYAGRENFYALYRIHNLHFEVYGAMFLAQPSVALAASDRLRAEVPDEVVAVYPDLFETFVASKPHVLIRFGMWEAILEEAVPENAELYAVTRALMFYARAVALANLGRASEAEAEAARFDAAYEAIPDTRKLFQNKARDVLDVARAMMRGELTYKAGRVDEGLAHLRAAVALDDGLYYEEPWAWPQPTRHALGALLMEAGRYDEAEAVYRADLGLDPALPRALQNPGNIWALHGLDECLARRAEAVERPHIARHLQQAAARAEIAIMASCACRSV